MSSGSSPCQRSFGSSASRRPSPTKLRQTALRRRRWREDQQPRGALHVLRPFRNQRAPARERRLDAETEEGQEAFRQDDLRHDDGHEDDDRAMVFGMMWRRMICQSVRPSASAARRIRGVSARASGRARCGPFPAIAPRRSPRRSEPPIGRRRRRARRRGRRRAGSRGSRRSASSRYRCGRRDSRRWRRR